MCRPCAKKGKYVRKYELIVGDFVLKGSVKKYRKNKLAMYWTGPYKVSQVLSDYLFELEYITSGERSVSHGSRVKHFRNSSFAVTDELIDFLQYQKGEYCIFDSLLDIRRNKGIIEVQVQWKGFDDEDPTWTNIEELKEDIPIMVDEFLSEVRSSRTSRQRKIAQNI